tara:strand:+ start:7317 stop:7559 length:243 start_codon:yes stop_codon:yes gene_type:complete
MESFIIDGDGIENWFDDEGAFEIDDLMRDGRYSVQEIFSGIEVSFDGNDYSYDDIDYIIDTLVYSAEQYGVGRVDSRSTY